ncbi:MAG TPA: radical SAM protein [Tissierellia bacterium]|nr:radical SAM protein [Tissierellia bacterium]
MMEFTIYLTTKCNFSCKYCYEDYHEHLDLSKEKLIEIIQFILNYANSQVINISFMGGEPLLKKDLIYTAVEYVKREYPYSKIKYDLTTNCSLVDEKFIDFISQNRFSIRISFDGLEKAHNLNRISKNGYNYHNKIVKNIKKTIDKKIPYSIRMTIAENTIPFLFENIVYLHENKMDNISIILDVNMVFTDELLEEFKKQIVMIKDYYLEECNKGRKFSIDQFDGKFLNLLSDFGNHFTMCDAGVTNFKIMPNGDLYPCGFVSDNSAFKLGNIKESINLEKGKLLAYSLFDKKHSKCNQCNIQNFCFGMKCGYMNYLCTGKVNIPSKLTCQFEHVYYPIARDLIINLSENKEKGKLILEPYINYIEIANLKLSDLGRQIKTKLCRYEGGY